VVIINIPTRHFYSPYATKTTLLHLLPTSSKVRSSRQYAAVTLVMDQFLVEVMICVFVAILKLINHGAILDAHTNFLLVMSIAVYEHRTFLLVSINSSRQKSKSSTEKCLCLRLTSTKNNITLITTGLSNHFWTVILRCYKVLRINIIF
jgi:hypothetical protein